MPRLPRLTDVSRYLPERVVRSLILRTGLLSRAMTLGARVAVTDTDGRILLVRHTYISGWHFPGGAVDPGESAEAAAVRELREEAGVIATARPTLFGIYRNAAAAGRDHVALYRLDAFTIAADETLSGEIAAADWFARDALPLETTRATHARLAELFDGVPSTETW